MEIRVVIFCFVLTSVRTDDRRFYKTDLTSDPYPNDQTGEKSEHRGFVEPLDFASFTSQFFHGGESQNFAAQPFTSGGGFDFFGAESKDTHHLRLPAGGSLNFPASPFAEQKENGTGFVQPVNFVSAFDGQASPSSAVYRPEYYAPALRSTLAPAQPTVAETEDEEDYVSPSPASYRSSNRAPKRDYYQGKSNYPSPRPGHKSEHAPTAAVYANSEDVEVFYPPGRAILPQLNGRPKPYDGYRAASDVDSRVHGRRNAEYDNRPKSTGYQKRRPVEDKRPQQFQYGEQPAETRNRKEIRQEHRSLPAEEEEDEEEAEEENPKRKNSGYKYKYDSSIRVPDLVIRKYPYEKEVDNDEEFTHDYEHYKQSLPQDLEKHFGQPEYEVDKYTVAATENLEKDKNCEKVAHRGKRDDEEVSKTCYVCRDPKTGGSYEQCAYQNEPTSNKYFYGGSTSSASQKDEKPVQYRYKRSLDFFNPPSFEYFVYNDEPNLNRKARAETNFQIGSVVPTKPPKRKTKKYKASSTKKHPKRKVRQQKNYDPSSEIEGPPASYNGPKYTYEGPSEAYEGPTSAYEGPSSSYEGPDHDDYYDRTDDRIAYETNPPLLSSFFDNDRETKKRPRRGPKADVEEFNPSDGYLSDYRFGPEFFDDEEGQERPEPAKRNAYKKLSKQRNPEPAASNEEFFAGNVKIFKNGDVCEKTRKESMLCMVCNNDKTGAKYEQCQYSTKPNQQGYTYGSQKSFSTNKGENDRPQRHIRADQTPEISDKVEKKYMITKMESKKTFNEGSDEPLVTGESRVYQIRKERGTDEDAEEQSEDTEEAAEEAEEEDDGKTRTETSERVEARDDIDEAGIDEFLGNQKGSSEASYPKEQESYDDYFKRVFPEFEAYGKLTPDAFDPFAELLNFRENGPTDSNGEYINFEESESKNKPTRLKDEGSAIPKQFYANDDESKKDLAEAYASFQKRDWSKCKQIKKDKLTCYTCLNTDGIKNEECMFVEGSNPVSSHVAYHEKKDYDPAASSIEAQTRLNATEPPPIQEAQTPEETSPSEVIKGDFEGVERPKKVYPKSVRAKNGESSPTKKRKYPVKKYGEKETNEEIKEEDNQESTWESSKDQKVDDSVVRIYFNNTDPTTATS